MAKNSSKRKASVSGIHFTLQVWREGGAYVAYSPELDISSCGDSLAQAKDRLREAVSLFLEQSSRMGTLEAILSEAGFEKSGNAYHPHRILARERVRLALPVAS
jgi:predicted RNase H-like HicB family nuclease